MRTDLTAQPVPIRLRNAYGDLILLDKQRAWTWVEIPEVPYAFGDVDERKDVGWGATMALARIKTGWVHLKKRPHSTASPVSVGGWKDRRAAHVAQYGDPSPRYPGLLDLTEQRMLEQQPFARQTFMGVELGRRGVLAQLADQMPLGDEPISPRERQKWERAAAAQRDALRRGALHAEPVDAGRLRQLRQHTAYRGLDVPAPTSTLRKWWGHLETFEEFADVEWRPVTFTSRRGVRTCLKVTSPTTGGAVYSASWVISVMPQKMLFPATPPWLAHADGLAFPAEVDAHLELVTPRIALRRIRNRLVLARDQEKDSRYADVDLPIETSEVIDMARQWEYQIPTRRMPMVWGRVVIRAEADTPEQLEGMFEQAEEHYAKLRIDLAWPSGMSQVDLALQSIPGAPRKFSSYKQMWPVETIGCGLMHAGSGLAHPNGLYAGVTTGRTRQVVTWNPHWAITRNEEHGEQHIESAGGTVILGMPRSGKSSALVSIAHDAAEAGIRTVMVDMGGETAKTQALAPDRIDVVDVLAAGGGSADPMSPHVVPGDPTDPKVRSAREQLTYSTFSTYAWRQLRADPSADSALIAAIQKVSASQDPRSGAVIAELVKQRTTKSAHNLGKSLEFGLGGGPEGQVLVGDGGQTIAEHAVKPLTILKAQGLVQAEAGKPMIDWSLDELLGASVFGIVAYRARQMVWGRARGDLGLVILDEAHIPLATPAGLSVISDLFRNGPKYGNATILATHNASAVSQDFIRNGTSTWMLFRATDPDEISLGLHRAGIEDSRENRDIRRGLRNGECVAAFPGGQRDRFRWDQWHEGVREAANTTAGRRPVAA